VVVEIGAIAALTALMLLICDPVEGAAASQQLPVLVDAPTERHAVAANGRRRHPRRVQPARSCKYLDANWRRACRRARVGAHRRQHRRHPSRLSDPHSGRHLFFLLIDWRSTCYARSLGAAAAARARRTFTGVATPCSASTCAASCRHADDGAFYSVGLAAYSASIAVPVSVFTGLDLRSTSASSVGLVLALLAGALRSG
jgi:hypothetical protein